MRSSKSTNLIKGQKDKQSPSKNFKIISQKAGAYETQSKPITNMKSDTSGAVTYRTVGKDEKFKGHQRIETWHCNPLSNRKSSNIGVKSGQSLQNST